ncbi:uncharacterized protein LOC119080274 [Bradysia coprophila]|uniref:uncharacterized protein LOC119080274 n=1 Tax=Bradysia coprophila TaxID=38358 RepID=UPI00187DAF0F|nr:uncharacterized protein LOC119080274 [Bradysia coprophila]
MIQKHFFISLCACFLLVDPLTAAEETICKEFSVHSYVYNKFYNLSRINGVRSDDYFVKLPVTFDSDRGDIHVAFSESTDTKNASRVYEFALGSYDNTLFEIRRKDFLLEKRDFNGNRFADYSVPTDREFNVEFSISRSGVVQIVEAGSGFKLSLIDQLPVIDVKYVSFAGYRDALTKVTFDCVNVGTTEINSSTKLAENDDKINEI